MNEKKWKTAVCPECGLSIQFSIQPALYHLLLCPQCETLLVVTAVSPASKLGAKNLMVMAVDVRHSANDQNHHNHCIDQCNS